MKMRSGERKKVEEEGFSRKGVRIGRELKKIKGGVKESEM